MSYELAIVLGITSRFLSLFDVSIKKIDTSNNQDEKIHSLR
jgi:hypothetical protein